MGSFAYKYIFSEISDGKRISELPWIKSNDLGAILPTVVVPYPWLDKATTPITKSENSAAVITTAPPKEWPTNIICEWPRDFKKDIADKISNAHSLNTFGFR